MSEKLFMLSAHIFFLFPLQIPLFVTSCTNNNVSVKSFLCLVNPPAAAHSSSGIGEGEGMRSCSGRGVTLTDPTAALGPPRPHASGEQPGLAAPDASRVTQVRARARSVRWFAACPVTFAPAPS